MAEKKEVLVGGLGDKKPDSSFSSKSIQQGVDVEKEHSKNPKVRKEIAKDHLTEDPAYYDKLKQMENTPSFPGLDKLLNGFIEDNEQFLFGKDFGKGGGKSNYYQKPGITHISAEFRMTGQPKKADLSDWFVDDEQAKSAGWVDESADFGKQGAEEKEKKPKLGPLEHAYVADAVGASPHVRLSEFLPGKITPESGWYDRLLAAAAPLNKTYGERVQVGASRMADSPKLRLMSVLDPTANKDQAGLVELLAAGNWGQESDLLSKAREKYKNIIKPHQDKLIDPNGPVTSRETPWHLSMQAMLADKDTDIAGHTYLRKERPAHYWLNPLSKAGPFREMNDRVLRRALAGAANHESTAGRFAAGAIPFYSLIVGGSEAQNKLRRLAYKNKMYDPAAEPDVLVPQKKQADWVTDLKNRGMAFAGDVANQFEPSQFGRAANTFMTRKDRDGYLEAARAGHGQLSDPMRGLTGGGAGLLAGALLPSGMRGVGMPLAGGLGAAMAMANGPNGFEWKNMLTPKALAAGGLGALAGYLGNQAMGGDEEEETTDLLGRPVKRRSSDGSNWLMPALGLGAAGLGGYALYNHFNPANKQAPPPPVSPAQATARGVGQGFAGVGNAVGKALGGNPLSQVGNTANSLLSAARGRLANIAAAQSAGSSIGQGIAGLGSAVGSAVSGLTTPAAPPANPTASAANLAGYGINQAVTQGIPAIGNAAKAWANSGTPKPPAAPTSSILTPNQQGMVNSAISAPAPKAPPAVNIPPAVSQGISAARSMAGSVPSIPVDAVRGAAGAGAAAGRAAGGMMGRAPSGPVSMPSVPNVAPSIGRGLAGVRDALASTSSLSGMGNALRDAAGGIKSMVTAPRLPAGIDKVLSQPRPPIPTAADLMKRPAAPTFTPPKPAPPVNPTFIPPKPAPAVLPNTAVPIGQLKSSTRVPSTAAKPSLALNEQGPLAPNQRRGDYSLGNHGVRIWNGNNGAAPVPKQGKYYPATYDSAYLLSGRRQDEALNKRLGDKASETALDVASGVNDEGADVAMFNALREGQSPEQFNRKYRDKAIVNPGRITIPETRRRMLGLLPPKIKLTAPSHFVDLSQVSSPKTDQLSFARQSSGITPASLSEADRLRLMALVDDLYMSRTANLAFGDYKPSPIPQLTIGGKVKTAASLPDFIPLSAKEQIERERKKRELAARERSLTPLALAGAGMGLLGSKLYRTQYENQQRKNPSDWQKFRADNTDSSNTTDAPEYAHDSGFALDSVANPPPMATWKDTPIMDLGPAFLSQ